MTRVTWTETKRLRILAERGVDFIDAAGIFDGPCIVREDRRRDYGETRYVALGRSEEEYFYVVYTPRKDEATGEDVLHVITAWRAGQRSRHRYQELYDRRAEEDA
jgi:uncharacterized DUF497 family protein